MTQINICANLVPCRHQFLCWIRELSLQQIRRKSTTLALDSEKNLSQWDQARPFEEVPTFSKLTLLRNFLPGGKYYKQNFGDLIINLQKDHGDIFSMPGLFGKQSILLTCNPEDFEKVFRTEGQWPIRKGMELMEYHRGVYRKDFFQGVNGILSTQHEQWGKFRSIVNPVLMQPKNVRVYIPKMSEVNLEFVERIKEIRDPKTLEVPDSFEDEINRWTLESVSVVALDKKMGLIRASRDNPDAKKLFTNLTDFFRISFELEVKPSLWKFIRTPKFTQMMNALDGINEITMKYVNEAVERLEREKSSVEKSDSEKSVLEKLLKIDKKIATVMAMDMLMAGVDTTTSTFTGVMLCLAKNPEKQEKLREEIRRVLPEKDTPITPETMKNLPYLRACIKEGLRLYPLTSGNMRRTQKDLVLSGYQVPKGTDVSMVTLSLNVDPKYYPRPDEFIPERWLRRPEEGCPASAGKSSNPFVSLPFGFGPRSCIGKRIVEMELEVGIARIIRNFNVEFNYSTENAFQSLIIMVPAIPLKFKFADVID